MSRAWAVAALLACGAAVSARADDFGRTAGASAAVPAADEATAARVALLTSRVAAADAVHRDRTAAELGASSAWQDLLAVFRDVSGDFRHPERGELVLEAMARSGVATLREMLAAAAAKGADPLLVVVALRVAARPAADVALGEVLAVGLAMPAEERRSPSVQSLLQSAVAAALDRHADDAEVLRHKWASLDTPLRASCIDGAASARRAPAARVLSRLLDTGAPGDGEILRRLAAVPVREEEPFDPGLDAFLASALGAADPDLRAGAARFAGRVGGADTAEVLLGLLRDADPSVVSAAHGALETACGAPLAKDPELWRVRLDAERAWFGGDREADLAGARRGDPALAAAALRRLGAHRLHAASLAPAVEGLADHSDPAVRAAACETLGRLRRPSSIRVLLRATEEPEPAVAAAAGAALAEVTGLAAPAEPAEWRGVLEPGRR